MKITQPLLSDALMHRWQGLFIENITEIVFTTVAEREPYRLMHKCIDICTNASITQYQSESPDD